MNIYSPPPLLPHHHHCWEAILQGVYDFCDHFFSWYSLEDVYTLEDRDSVSLQGERKIFFFPDQDNKDPIYHQNRDWGGLLATPYKIGVSETWGSSAGTQAY